MNSSSNILKNVYETFFLLSRYKDIIFIYNNVDITRTMEALPAEDRAFLEKNKRNKRNIITHRQNIEKTKQKQNKNIYTCTCQDN